MKNAYIYILFLFSTLFTQDVSVWVSDATEDFIEISMSNTQPVNGFQFNLVSDPSLGAVFGSPFGGTAEEASFLVSSNEIGTLIGFSLTANEIPVGNSIVLTNLYWTGENGCPELAQSTTF